MSSDWKFDTKFEYTAKATLQQNLKGETSFTVLSVKSQALMNAANMPQVERYQLFAEYDMTVSKLDWLTMIDPDARNIMYPLVI